MWQIVVHYTEKTVILVSTITVQKIVKYIVIMEIKIGTKDYSHTTYTSRLWDMLCEDKQNIEAYIQPDREFWHFDGSKSFRKLKVTYVRSGVMFFVFENEPDIEKAWFIGSFNSDSLHAAQIYPYEIGKLLSKQLKGYDKKFPEICKQCKWDDCNGRIKVEVIWDR